DTDKDKLLTEGTGTSKNFDELVERLNKKYDFKLSKDVNLLPNSDHYPFYKKEIPVIFYWTGYHPDYHKPSDTSDKINVAGMARVAAIAEDTIDYLATVPERPDWVKVPTRSFGSGLGGNVPRLGFTPGYGDEGEGVLMSEVSEGGPAAKAGLK